MRSVLGHIALPPSIGGLCIALTRYLERVDRELSRQNYRGEVTWNPASIANGSRTTQTVVVPGVLVGTRYYVRVFAPYTLSGLGNSGYVSADDQATIVLVNNTGGAVDLGSGDWGVICEAW